MKKWTIPGPLPIAGSFWIALGTFAFASPRITYLTVVQYTGVALLLDSLLLIATSYGARGSLREREWTIVDGIVDLLFSAILLLDPVLTLFALPFLLSPWMIARGIIKIIASLSLARKNRAWAGDLFAGVLLILFALWIPHNPFDRPYGITVLIGIAGWTLGLVYLYDSFRRRIVLMKIIAPPYRHHTLQ